MRGRVLMTGKKDTKTGLWMFPLSIDKSTISPAAASMISQVASDVLKPIAATAHQETQSVSPQLSSTISASETNFFARSTQNTHSCFDCQNPRSQGATQELIYNMTPTTNIEELAIPA